MLIGKLFEGVDLRIGSSTTELERSSHHCQFYRWGLTTSGLMIDESVPESQANEERFALSARNKTTELWHGFLIEQKIAG